ncbi:MAG TPA: hypothetical protein VJZ71_02785 [Phycisphaerae bacterium]|nr:hypothetical protein [Phycisphaerae bacterium]
MNEEFDIPAGVDEPTERLICRSIDGELTADERAELTEILRTNAAARRLLDEYTEIDRLAIRAIRRDLESAKTVAAGRFRGIRLAAAGAVFTAAAVIALSFLPNLWTGATLLTPAGPIAVQSQIGHGRPQISPADMGRTGQFVDYREYDSLPQQRRQDVYRDLIGVRGKNNKNQDVIYIFERNTQATKITPISGDF